MDDEVYFTQDSERINFKSVANCLSILSCFYRDDGACKGVEDPNLEGQ